ncbi:hypothetical protein Ocin01_00255 [Orchesella cincta]|uniref:EOG090X09QP n=1 Tax=Orchesella cincta TaxID=48709 RepID=A0A1D2NNA7_ORCCI|nr:hypothetical protein Ocin01_00255 [Orchesella cincta]
MQSLSCRCFSRRLVIPISSFSKMFQRRIAYALVTKLEVYKTRSFSSNIPRIPELCYASSSNNAVHLCSSSSNKMEPFSQFSSPQVQPDQTASGSSPPQSDKPSLDDLQKVYNALQTSLERLFTHPMNYSLYHPDIVFIDNIRNIRTQGLAKYIQQVAFVKIAGHLKFAFVKFEIINMSMSHEEGRITVRWRIKGLSGLRVMLKFWKYKLWKWQEIKNNQETWFDGISYFDVGADAKIFQHLADKVMEDKHRGMDEKPRGNIPLAAKLGALATIFPTPSPSLFLETANHSSTIAGLLQAT